MEFFGPAKSVLFFDIEFHLYCFVCSIFSCFRFVGFQGKVELNQWEEKLMLTFCNNVLGALFLVAMWTLTCLLRYALEKYSRDSQFKWTVEKYSWNTQLNMNIVTVWRFGLWWKCWDLDQFQLPQRQWWPLFGPHISSSSEYHCSSKGHSYMLLKGTSCMLLKWTIICSSKGHSYMLLKGTSYMLLKGTFIFAPQMDLVYAPQMDTGQ